MPEKELMSPNDIKCVNELKARMKDELDESCNDLKIYLFLKEQNFNLDATENMLKKHVKWRKKKNVEEMKNYTPPELLKQYFAHTLLGRDKEGCLVKYWPLGSLDFKGLFLCFKFSDMEKLFLHINETDTKLLEEESKKRKKDIYQVTYIYDIEGITFARATDKKALEALIYLSLAYFSNYPQRMKACYLINTNALFIHGFSICKRFLPISALNAIYFFGADDWKDVLLKDIDAEVLPAFLGGTKTDPDGNPLCETLIKSRGSIPEKYYKHKSKRPLSKMPGVKQITLSRASFHEESIEVKESQSLLEWEFETKSRDIGFGLFFRDMSSGEEKMVEIVPILRIDTDEYAESGVYKCEKEGTYVILFDNTYSWIRPKEISFRIAVINPKDHDNKLHSMDETLQNEE
ncbi:SEC14-like protein 2 [Uloborus diversus]|uniref:SEC14-like protein 2 n=1 Tax=Uloborus diversus TaxID=327109 RepID=UPI00240A88C2|nr:SEC14-like protein 2 [Uloborus diversus]XP_054714833.1 SEC14-like protein 2 [Uloborus diversus]